MIFLNGGELLWFKLTHRAVVECLQCCQPRKGTFTVNVVSGDGWVKNCFTLWSMTCRATVDCLLDFEKSRY